ncbi:Solute carrier family 2, facilitated glucose transporter member 3 [Portunus trituberculatus]|uniref:Solute carrier family 2, facilitated glucose transporter member 3 n=1 Tax=Portunus trituberculatus TaxID=210409 RepID=A0A5B7CPG5_PORTR|nr:Solute carrier family 2, facilitated glucose transporter member 3 [Portunus trituberculatus]
MNVYELEMTEKVEVSVWAVVVSLFIGGAIAGTLLGGRLADTMGRKKSLLVNHLLCLISGIFLMFCKFIGSVEMLVIGRFMSGFCTGTENGWPFLLGAFMVLVVVAILAHPALPESPIFYYTMEQDEVKGLRELQRLRGKDSKAVEVEDSALKTLAHQIKEAQRSNTCGAMFLLRSSTYRMPLLLTILANAAQQFSGVNAVFYYSTLIFRSAGLDQYQSQGASIGAGAINVIMSILAVPLVRHCRRRVLLLSSMVLCVLCQSVLVGALWFLPSYSWASYVAIFSLLAYVLVFGIGLGPIPFMIATELFPVGPRSVGIVVGGTTNWFTNMIVGLTFPVVQSEMAEFSFILFIASVCFFAIFMYNFLPETFRGMHIDSQEDVTSESSKKTMVDLDIGGPAPIYISLLCQALHY